MADWAKQYVKSMRDYRDREREREKKYRMDADGNAKRYMKQSGYVLDMPIVDAEFTEVVPEQKRLES